MNTTHPPSPGGPAPREWTPRLWEGCDLFAWLRLLARNRFAVHPAYWYIAAIITPVSLTHTVLRYLQEGLLGSRADRTPLAEHPLFIVGHWRTGTTLLHELLILDPRHGYPNTYQCLVPNHFLLTEAVGKRCLGWIMPSRRPMDNMAAGWDRPQEDEFALCMLGQPSPYLSIAFPNRPPQGGEALELEDLPPRQRREWESAFLRYLRRLTYRDPRRLVLKSPTHSFRIPTLRRLFPDARFVHIVRDPYVVFPSTVNLWRTLYQTHGLQRPTYEGLEESVFRTFNRLYERIEEGKKLLSPRRFHEVRYEDLIADPVGRMAELYDRLELGGFEEVRPRLEEYLRSQAGYQTNRYPQLAQELRDEITRRWGEIIGRYGYEKKSSNHESHE
jgi:hypothetical protein